MPAFLAKKHPGKRLIMMRHADSEERLQNVRDHDRPITEAGRACAMEVAQKLAERGWLPDLIMSSDSSRTRQTLSTMAAAVAAFGEAVTHFRGSLYTVAALDGQLRQHLQGLVVEEVKKTGGDVACVLCLGHNKGMEEAASSLTGKTIRLETANAALLERAAASWEEALCDEPSWTLVELLQPDTCVAG
ncbi:phosphoglycerate mutase-like protein [Coccomyxa subellipsoidea C-169]|uniref:Phosphoglycerate mutase-like protein n=1 Tax=Coccomyxa subellipsoidea (strain C-169) TaxID=574566 RepID=I0Z1H8_COCSC|nr:phosphoglycerate mutase-like protein [Coccomyxa subellipsoidea C-169]EIE24497.1 phosphoglycerate mutase-like protein [Coccomyxa subellipsoidea C-169]|eukprot:XP_005649041.1 phosphoglycerate mutase-like protein [Coccomyxa subellipsoidea C-169]